MQKLKATMSIGLIIGIFLTIVIALSLLPTIADLSIGVNTSLTNITGVTYTLISLVPVFFIIGVILLLVSGLKITGKI